jgi:hypothetical protein
MVVLWERRLFEMYMRANEPTKHLNSGIELPKRHHPSYPWTKSVHLTSPLGHHHVPISSVSPPTNIRAHPKSDTR